MLIWLLVCLPAGWKPCLHKTFTHWSAHQPCLSCSLEAIGSSVSIFFFFLTLEAVKVYFHCTRVRQNPTSSSTCSWIYTQVSSWRLRWLGCSSLLLYSADGRDFQGRTSSCSRLQEAGWATSPSSLFVSKSRAGWAGWESTRKHTAILNLLPGIPQVCLSGSVTHRHPALPSTAAAGMLRVKGHRKWTGIKNTTWALKCLTSWEILIKVSQVKIMPKFNKNILKAPYLIFFH